MTPITDTRTLKVGDRVHVAISRHGVVRYEAKRVVKVSPGTVKLSNGDIYNRDGRKRGDVFKSGNVMMHWLCVVEESNDVGGPK